MDKAFDFSLLPKNISGTVPKTTYTLCDRETTLFKSSKSALLFISTNPLIMKLLKCTLIRI